MTLVGIYFIEIGKNAVNECVDFNSGVDRLVTPDHRTPFSGGKKTLVDGALSAGQVRAIAWVCTAAGGVTGVFIAWLRDSTVLWVGCAGLFAALFYSLPPLSLAYRGFGELFVGLTFGPVMTTGAYLVQAQRFNVEALLIGIPIGLLIANVLWINEFPDYEADMQGGKQTGVVRLGRRRAVTVLALIYVAAYGSMLLLGLLPDSHGWGWALLTLPIAWKSVVVARRWYDQIPRLIPANAATVQTYALTGLLLVLTTLLTPGG